jgi:hypothetical protein
MRVIAVATCIVALVGFAFWIFGPKSGGTFGLTLGNGARASIISVDSTSPFIRDGVHAGDIVRFDHMSLLQRLDLTEPATGLAATISVEHDGSITTFTEAAVPAPAPPVARQIALWILVLIYAAITPLIAWRAPPGALRTTIMSVVAPLALAYSIPIYEHVIRSPLTSAILDVIGPLCIATSLASMFSFIAIFPPRSTPVLRWVRIVGFPLTIAASTIFFLTYGIDYAFGIVPLDVKITSYVGLFAFTVWIVGIIDAVVEADKSHRTPAVVAGSTLFVLASININLALTSLFGWNAAWEGYLQWLQWACGFGVSYAVLRHRLLDLNLVVSRATIFSLVSLSLIVMFVLAEWALATLTERIVGSSFSENAKTALTGFVALCLGLSARRIHRVVEHRLNRLFFAKRYRALADLHRFSLETDAATNPSALLELTLSALRRDLDAQYVALYTGTPESGYIAAGATSSLPIRLDENDEIVLRLRRWGEAFVVENDSHYLFGAYICSMMLRGTLYGFAICGPKIDRTGYLPDERETVAALTHRVGIAYEWLTRGTANPVLR